MNEGEIKLIVQELKNIILNKPLSNEFNERYSVRDESNELYQVMNYLSDSLSESNEFLRTICRGEIEVIPPGRYNFLASSLKELHSILKHITWQANQIATGDYTQHIDHLGDFSRSFNLMTEQLKEREEELKNKNIILENTSNLLTSIMDAQENWIIVIGVHNKEVLYVNKSAQEFFYNPVTNKSWCKKGCALLKILKDSVELERELSFEYCCETFYRYISIKSFTTQWNSKDAIIYFLTDITNSKLEKEQLAEFAYKDELTGTYNRRFGFNKLNEYYRSKITFSIVLIDLDGLKYVNDNFGHTVGDEYIGLVVEMIQRNIREDDLICRIGGDEFIIILPRCEENIVRNKMQQIGEQVKNTEKGYPLSISYGITYVSEQNELSIVELMNITDEKMYKHKSANKSKKYNIDNEGILGKYEGELK